MKIATLNIRHGGGRRHASLVEHLARHEPDVLVLTEFRERAGVGLRKLLHERWPHQHWSPTRPRENGLLIASRTPLGPVEPAADAPGPMTRWCEVEVGGVRLVAAYLPAVRKPLVPFWERVLAHARPRITEPWLIVGDFNTGVEGIDASNDVRFSGHSHFLEMLRLGFVDAWRARNAEAREYSWFSARGNGFRVDHMLVAPALATAVQAATYDHTTRTTRATDHAMLVVDLSAQQMESASVLAQT